MRIAVKMAMATSPPPTTAVDLDCLLWAPEILQFLFLSFLWPTCKKKSSETKQYSIETSAFFMFNIMSQPHLFNFLSFPFLFFSHFLSFLSVSSSRFR